MNLLFAIRNCPASLPSVTNDIGIPRGISRSGNEVVKCAQPVFAANFLELASIPERPLERNEVNLPIGRYA